MKEKAPPEHLPAGLFHGLWASPGYAEHTSVCPSPSPAACTSDGAVCIAGGVIDDLKHARTTKPVQRLCGRVFVPELRVEQVRVP